MTRSMIIHAYMSELETSTYEYVDSVVSPTQRVTIHTHIPMSNNTLFLDLLFIHVRGKVYVDFAYSIIFNLLYTLS